MAAKSVKRDRAYHEQFAIEAVESAKRELPSTFDCSAGAVYATVRMNRDIARARAHLASIGGHDSSRTQKLWSAVEQVQRKVDLASNRIAKCVLRCPPAGDLLGRARRRRKR
jgi:hypothetical protein